jgi:hypothetical protein
MCVLFMNNCLLNPLFHPVTISDEILFHINIQKSLPMKEPKRCPEVCQQTVGRSGLHRL